MASMNWKEIEIAATNDTLVLVPVSVIEEHGPHLSLAVDCLCSYILCRLIREELKKFQRSSLISPPYYWGINNATGGFPGSFTVRKETLRYMIIDLLLSLHRWGFKRLFIINWHGDKEHLLTIVDAIQEAGVNFGVRAFIVLSEFEVERLKISQSIPYIVCIKEDQARQNYLDIHAGSDEVSIISNFFPEHVNEELASRLEPTNLTKEDLNIWNKGWFDTKTLIPEGYFGNPKDFSKEKGRVIIEQKSKLIATQIESFLRMNG